GDPRGGHELGAFLSDIAGGVGEVGSRVTPGQQLAGAILRGEGEGVRTRRLEQALAAQASEAGARALVEEFAQDVERLTDIAQRIRQLDGEARELERLEVLRNPDRVADAESLLAAVEARTRSLPVPPHEPRFAHLSLDPGLLAMR